MSFFDILNKLLSIKKPAKPSDLEELTVSVQKDYDQTGVELLNKTFIALGLKKEEEGQDNSLDVPPYLSSERYGNSYNHWVYQKLLPLCQLAYLSEQNGIAEEHAFKLATIFDKEQAALSYLLKRAKNIRPSKNSASANEYVVHDGCLFDLPAPDTCHFKQWQQLARTHLENPRFRELLPHAAELERIGRPIMSAKKKKLASPGEIKQEKERLPLITQKKDELSRLIKKRKDLDTKPVTNLTPAELTKRQEDLSVLGKAIGEQRRELTQLCQGLPFHQMDVIVLQAFYESYQHTANAGHKILIDNSILSQEIAKFYQLNKAKKEDFIPNVFLDGQELGYPGFYLKKLDTLSDQGAALAACLGKITKCCQYLGGVGGACAIHGITSPNGGFYVVCKGNAERPSLEDPIVAQAWVWRGQSKGLCLDSIETAPQLKESERPMIADFFRLLGHTLCQKHGIPKVNTGAQSGITRGIALKNCYTQKEHFLDYHGYCDSKSQLPLANQTMPYLFYGQTNSELLQNIITKETQLFFTTLFTTQAALKDNQTLKQALSFALHTQRGDLLRLLRDAAIDAKRQEEFEVLIQVNQQHRANLNQNMSNIGLIEQGADINMLNDKGKSALHIASLAVNLDLFEQLMALNPNLNLQDSDGNTVLLRVLEKIVYKDKNEDGLHIVARLIEAKADLDIKDKNEVTPLMLAVQNDDFLSVKTLIEHGADMETFDQDMKTALFLAAEKGLADIFDYLLKQGAKLNCTSHEMGDTLLIAAIKGKNLTIIKAILASPECDSKIFQQHNKNGEDALIWAIKSGREDLFQELLASPCFTDELLQQNGRLIVAVESDNICAVQTILKYDNTGLRLQVDNALALAIKNDRSKIAWAILASAYCTGDGMKTALFLAAEKGLTDIFDYLLQKGVPLNGTSYSTGDTVLIAAIKGKKPTIIKAILESPECDSNMLQQHNKKSENAITWAIRSNQEDLLQDLLASPYFTPELLQHNGGLIAALIGGKTWAVQPLLKCQSKA